MTRTEVANLALNKLGVGLIASIGDSSIPESNRVNLLFLPTLKRVLRDHQWSFAEAEIDLAQLPEAQNSNYEYTYSLPSCFVRLISLKTEYREISHDNFSRTGGHIHTDIAPVRIRYITHDIEPDYWEPDFMEAFATLLASELAKPLLQSDQMKQALLQEYLSVHLPKAKTVDSRETQSNENNGLFDSIRRSPLNQLRRLRGELISGEPQSGGTIIERLVDRVEVENDFDIEDYPTLP